MTRKRFEIFKRDGFRCVYCGNTPPEVLLEVDHVIAKSKGGTDDECNLVTSCKKCNLGKSNIPLAQLPTGHKATLDERKEKLKQLHEITKLSMETTRVIQSMVDEISRYWMVIEGEDPEEYCLKDDIQSSSRYFLKHMSIDQIKEAIDLTKRRMHYMHTKYFFAICWKRVKGTYNDKPNKDNNQMHDHPETEPYHTQ